MGEGRVENARLWRGKSDTKKKGGVLHSYLFLGDTIGTRALSSQASLVSVLRTYHYTIGTMVFLTRFQVEAVYQVFVWTMSFILSVAHALSTRLSYLRQQ